MLTLKLCMEQLFFDFDSILNADGIVQCKVEKAETLQKELTEASKNYYHGGPEVMDNFTFDKKMSELEELEEELGIEDEESITNIVEPESNNKLPKENHESPMLSLDKSKSVEDVKRFLHGQAFCGSLKMDGLTGVAIYIDGKLHKLVSRGNGLIGSVLCTAPIIRGLPRNIPYGNKLVVRGEICMSFEDFDEANADGTYENARNLASGVAQAQDLSRVKDKKLNFSAFNLVIGEGVQETSFSKRLDFLKTLGIGVVEHAFYANTNENTGVDTFIKNFTALVNAGYKNPVDGLVVMFDDIEYAASLPDKQKKSGKGFAFKWQDAVSETNMEKIMWSASKTGRINPIGVFKTVRIENTNVSSASLCNISELRRLGITKDSRVGVIKANMIIPKIVSVIAGKGEIEIPEICPVCGKKTEIVFGADGQTEVLMCKNPQCSGKRIGKMEHFVSRDAMNIDGLAGKKLEQLVGFGYVKNRADIFTEIEVHKNELVKMDGWGEKSVTNLLKAIEKARTTTLVRFLYSLAIPNIGMDVSEKISTLTNGNFQQLLQLCSENFPFTSIKDIGDTIENNIYTWYRDTVLSNNEQHEELEQLLSYVAFETVKQEKPMEQILAGMVFVVTGNVKFFKNRDELKTVIKSKGGTVSGSVSGNTKYLINNDITSTSGKNQDAARLHVPVISEEQFISMFCPEKSDRDVL